MNNPSIMKIAYLEDDAGYAEVVGGWLREAGYDVDWFSSGVECARAVIAGSYDGCLFDWMVADLSGIEVLARLRIRLNQAMPPVVFVTGRDGERDIVEALDAGADDYVVKPLSKPVLLARLQAVLRRHGVGEGLPSVQEFGRLTVDHDRRLFFLDGDAIKMTVRDTDMALYFFKNIGRLLTRDRLIEIVWARSLEAGGRTVDVHVSKMRHRLGLTPEFGWRLIGVYGRGYRLERL
ncbi:MAG: response regulator transcription factor [Candidatus Accumulibacter sp.]|jgi:DNA-binding response OmpR family regulator|nr:response regulator transcription factor [Accumulibacter sp.]